MPSALLIAGCSGASRTRPLPPAFGGFKTKPGVTAVVPLAFAETAVLGGPISAGEGAAAGASRGVGGILRGGGVGGDPAAALLLIALLPLAAIIGAIAGGSGGRSDEEVRQAATAIKNAFDEVEPAVEIRDRVVARGAKRNLELRPFEISDADTSMESFGSQGIDTVLELDVSAFGLTVEHDTAPDAVVYAGVTARLCDTSTGQRSIQVSLRHGGQKFEYFDLAENDARLLRAEIDRVLDAVAEQITLELVQSSA